MKTILLSIALHFVLLHICFAQKLAPAMVFRVDSTQLKVYGIKLQGSQVTYHLIPSVKSKTIRVPKSEISRIRYSNGKEEFVTIKLLPAPPLLSNGSLKKSFSSIGHQGPRPDRIYLKDGRVIECNIIENGMEEVKYVVATDNSRRVRSIRRKEILRVERTSTADNVLPKNQPSGTNYSYYALNFGLDMAQIVAGKSALWADDTRGLGLKMGFGASLQLSKRFSRRLGASLRVGYLQWETEKISRENGTTVYSASQKLQQMFCQIAPNLYLLDGLYLSPYVGIQQIVLKGRYSDSHPYVLLAVSPGETQSAFCFGYGGRMGYEITSRARQYSIELLYGIVARNFAGLQSYTKVNDPIHYVGGRIGIGLKK
ncbi:hypothetical protein [Dyadobacter arcticus]|uniref:Outer membrane protein beta-barrel domain-containing protein n=1 Tax=Dyadobacter arcticus TaxID=1078754 RepID=A0ABX0UH52_9BACT|nr:hypothetical protein [Dyadobacter arcticus]NIJ52301.1 hypothetical protein [Dyadobacter arcticus]